MKDIKQISKQLKKMTDKMDKENPDTGSDFGKGFVYNLILFAKHCAEMRIKLDMYKKMRERSPELFHDNDAVQMWFNAASDHFYELEIPEKWQETEIGRLAKYIQEKSLDAGHGSGLMSRHVTIQEYAEVFEKLEKLGLLIDKELGVEPIKARWN